MNGNGGPLSVPPFPPEYRASGLLLHVTSLPSPFGIGDIGPPAYSWVDRLHDSGQGWWQYLPIGPTGYGNSPYQPISSFAGNALLISPASLIAHGLLDKNECESSFSSDFVDYDAAIPCKARLLHIAWKRFKSGARADLRPEFDAFQNKHEHWLSDYTLFHALKDKYNGAYYLDWPEEVIQRRPHALGVARKELADEINQICFAQFLLFRQGDQLKTYAHSKGVKLIGDLPFFVSPDSSDVWANPELFLLDEDQRPRFVAGVPPDYFSAKGQLWGNPVYNWAALRASGYRWSIDRVRALLAHADVIRLDHFRAFAAAWQIPAGAPTAETGEWVEGPGVNFFQAVSRELGSLPFIVEDLGVITPDVRSLRDQFQLPGTRVLQFAFDGRSDNPYLPHNFVSNTVVYTGTHDNAPTREWFEELSADQRQNLWNYLQRAPGGSPDAAPALIGLAWSSKAALAIAPLQDLLNLGAEGRMNVPGRPSGNWRWRCREDMWSQSAFEWLRNLTETSKRSNTSTRSEDAGRGSSLIEHSLPS